MATDAEVATLRRLVNEATQDPYTDAILKDLIDSSANMPAAAAQIWSEKAARYSQLVNIKEGNSSRDLGDLAKNALAMAETFGKDAQQLQSRRSRTRPIQRM